MKNLIAGEFLFIGGTILMLVTEFEWAPIAGLVCALVSSSKWTSSRSENRPLMTKSTSSTR